MYSVSMMCIIQYSRMALLGLLKRVYATHPELRDGLAKAVQVIQSPHFRTFGSEDTQPCAVIRSQTLTSGHGVELHVHVLESVNIMGLQSNCNQAGTLCAVPTSKARSPLGCIVHIHVAINDAMT